MSVLTRLYKIRDRAKAEFERIQGAIDTIEQIDQTYTKKLNAMHRGVNGKRVKPLMLSDLNDSASEEETTEPGRTVLKPTPILKLARTWKGSTSGKYRIPVLLATMIEQEVPTTTDNLVRFAKTFKLGSRPHGQITRAGYAALDKKTKQWTLTPEGEKLALEKMSPPASE